MKFDDVILWLLSLFGGLVLCGARLGYLLFGVAPEAPTDPAALQLWRRHRRWLIFSELSALPAFATVSIIVGKLQSWSIEGVVLFSMVLGALGFAFFLDALQTIVRRKVGMKDKTP